MNEILASIATIEVRDNRYVTPSTTIRASRVCNMVQKRCRDIAARNIVFFEKIAQCALNMSAPVFYFCECLLSGGSGSSPQGPSAGQMRRSEIAFFSGNMRISSRVFAPWIFIFVRNFIWPVPFTLLVAVHWESAKDQEQGANEQGCFRRFWFSGRWRKIGGVDRAIVFSCVLSHRPGRSGYMTNPET